MHMPYKNIGSIQEKKKFLDTLLLKLHWFWLVTQFVTLFLIGMNTKKTNGEHGTGPDPTVILQVSDHS